MEKITTIGLDLAKSVFQVHAITEDGHVIVRRTLLRYAALATYIKPTSASKLTRRLMIRRLLN